MTMILPAAVFVDLLMAGLWTFDCIFQRIAPVVLDDFGDFDLILAEHHECYALYAR